MYVKMRRFKNNNDQYLYKDVQIIQININGNTNNYENPQSHAMCKTCLFNINRY